MAATAYRYQLPEGTEDRVKVNVNLARTDLLSAAVQVVRQGGETNLHAHNGEDAIWFVLGGTVAFYGEDGAKFELRKHEAIVLPSGTKYWFESVGDEPLEILRVGAKDPRVERTRTDVNPRERVQRVGTTPHRQAEQLEPASA